MPRALASFQKASVPVTPSSIDIRVADDPLEPLDILRGTAEGGARMTNDAIATFGTLMSYILDMLSAYPPAQGRNSHIPYDLWICPDGWRKIHDKICVTRWTRAGDGPAAVPVPFMVGERRAGGG